MARRYAFLRFAPGIDWKDVSPRLLADVNRLGMRLGKVITITSGYRTYAEQQALYNAWKAGRGNIAAKPGTSMHESGLAVDATIDGTPIARAVSARTLSRFGLVAPVNGDPVHLQLAGSGAAAPAASSGGNAAGAAPDTSGTATSLGSSAQPDLTIPSYLPAGAPPQPSETLPAVAAPGTAGAGLTSFDPAQAWQQIAQQPLVSPESQLFAQRVAQAQGAQ